MALWPTVTPSPTTVAKRPPTTWMVALSCTLLRAPIRMWWMSPRTTVWNHKLDCGPMAHVADDDGGVAHVCRRIDLGTAVAECQDHGGGKATPLDAKRRVR